VAFVALESLIALTGNYGFFNLLAVLLCFTVLDDQYLGAVFRRSRGSLEVPSRRWPALVPIVLFFSIFLTTSLQLAMFSRISWVNVAPARAWLEFVSPLRSANHYGLFAVMTTSRPEIVLEGSDDQRSWKAYEFRYKPGDVNRPPPFRGAAHAAA